MENTRAVEALKSGTVIDHIPTGQAMNILRLFKLPERGARITVGFNLSSRHMGTKDLIKVENVVLTEAEANQLALFAPTATVSVIDQFEVVKKHKLKLPPTIEGVFACPNSNCISHPEPVKSFFHVLRFQNETQFKCKYCERLFSREIVAVLGK